MKQLLILLPLAGALSACAGAQATRTSANTMIIDAGAAPACGAMGAAKVAQKSAAVETIRAGYDRYIITGGQSQNNVSVSQMPGHFQTSGTATYNRSFGTYNATTTYVPGPTIVSGSHDRSLGVVMFRNGEPGAENALDARQALGPEWQDIVKSGVHTCL
ncbi:hypothetical protein [Microvirga puerhi]|uniref:Uncharacterized protein n=1 Tax=Microvirga puerhi TaxID=2876078 RepID=A0ABS7VHD7_9HYPH|nr:hypothetical protein [Microvirga puerhi]MBZ6074906.1 hypothetical protein [Microvirga puerhi]